MATNPPRPASNLGDITAQHIEFQAAMKLHALLQTTTRSTSSGKSAEQWASKACLLVKRATLPPLKKSPRRLFKRQRLVAAPPRAATRITTELEGRVLAAHTQPNERLPMQDQNIRRVPTIWICSCRRSHRPILITLLSLLLLPRRRLQCPPLKNVIHHITKIINAERNPPIKASKRHNPLTTSGLPKLHSRSLPNWNLHFLLQFRPGPQHRLKWRRQLHDTHEWAKVHEARAIHNVALEHLVEPSLAFVKAVCNIMRANRSGTQQSIV